MLRKTWYALPAAAFIATVALFAPRTIATPPEGISGPSVALDQHERHPDVLRADRVGAAGGALLDLHERHPSFGRSEPGQPGYHAALDEHERHAAFHSPDL